MNESNKKRAEALWSVIRRWNVEDLTYVVLHGFDGHGAGRDLDFLVSRNHETRALASAAEELHRLGYDTAWPPPLYGRRLIAFQHNNWLTGVEIHSIPGVCWRNVVLAAQPGIAEIRNGIRTDPWASFAKRIIVPLLAEGGAAAPRLAREPALDRRDKPAICGALADLAGDQLAEQVLYQWRTGDSAALDQLASKIRKAISRRAWRRSPWVSFRRLARQLRRHVLRRFYPCAPVVALVGPDGIGKTTVLDVIRSGSSSLFPQVVIRHWRPGLLPAIADLLRGHWRAAQSGQPVPPRRTAGPFQWFRIVYYWLDYTLGWWILDRADCALQRAVVYDRCALDMIVDPLRFGLSTPRPGRWLWRLTVKPDLVVLLSAEPATIRRRKAEMTETEIREQYVAWNALRGEVGVRMVRANAAAPLDKVVEQVRLAIIQAFLEKNRRRVPDGGRPL